MCNEHILQVENATFTLLVFATNGGMAHECKTFYKRLAQMIPEKRSIDCSTATNFVRTKISFSLLRSTLMCIRGSRSFKRDFDLRKLSNSTSLPIFGRGNGYIKAPPWEQEQHQTMLMSIWVILKTNTFTRVQQ